MPEPEDRQGDEIPEFTDSDPDSTAVIIYTSGTTGSPKGVMLSFRNLHSNLRSVSEDVPIYRADDRVLILLPLHHILPLQGTLIMPLSLGATVVFCPSLSADDITATLQAHEITLVIGVPRLYTMIRNGIRGRIAQSRIATLLFRIAERLDSPAVSRRLFASVHRKFGGHVRYMCCGGAALDEDVIRDFRTLGFEILMGYGMSETAPMISFTRPGTHRAQAAGQVMPANEVRIVDNEITVRGENVMQGYFSRPEETAAVLGDDGWLRTGDLGHVDAEGYVFITGRRKELIVLPNGKNISPSEVESRLESLSPAVAEAAVLQFKGTLMAVIHPDFAFLRREGILNIEEYLRREVIERCNQKASPHKRLIQLSIQPEPLPRTRLGKLRRHELPDLVQAARRAPGKTPEPSCPEYAIIRDFLRSTANQDVYPDDHLEIDLGLDSLDKVSLQTFLESSFGVSFSEADLVTHSTPAALAERVGAERTRLGSEGVGWGEILRQRVNVRLPRSGLAHVWLNRAARILLRCCFRIRGGGLENLPDGPCILAPNHQSFLDGLLVTTFLHSAQLRKTFLYAKAEHVRSRWLRFLARTNNVIVMDIHRNVRESLQKLAEALHNGCSVIIFPEGTRSRDGRLGPFKKTFAILGCELGVPIIPVAIDGAYEAMPAGRLFPRPFRRIRVTFLPPVYPEERSYAAVAECVSAAVAQELT
jgi:long-chain acyl-CoA synthetase